VLIFCLAVVVSAGCRKGREVENASAPVPQMRSERTLEAVEEAILRGAADKGWAITKRSPGEMEATLHVRGKHTVVVAIPYTTESFSINYVRSVGMNYKDGKIHPNYHRWVENLRQSINVELSLK
jgi:hypothetical protein